MKRLIYTLMLVFVLASCQTNNTPNYSLFTRITNDRYGNIVLGVSDSAFSSLTEGVPIQKVVHIEIFDREGNEVDSRVVVLHETEWRYDQVCTAYAGELPSLPAGFYRIKIKATPEMGSTEKYEPYSVVVEEEFIVGMKGQVS